MAEYHVGAGEITGNIYAGTLSKDGKKWKDRTDVTDEAINAVRDHLVSQMDPKDTTISYEWKRKDGKKVTLTLAIKEDEDDQGSTE